MKSSTVRNLDKLKQRDVYSLCLFALYKMQDLPEYSSLSELVYCVDKESLLNICEFFGGQTIKIPTVHELELMITTLSLYQRVKLEGVLYEDAVKELKLGVKEERQVVADYHKLVEILAEYKFVPRNS